MKIDLKQISQHIKWLGLSLNKYSADSRINRVQESTTISITLEPIQIGLRKPVKSICKLKYKDENIINKPVFWEFREKWQLLVSAKKQLSQYEFCDLNIKLSDVSNFEFLSMHWTYPCPASTTYQPHWHLSSGGSRFYLNKIHFPINHSWRDYYPGDMNEYQGWLEGFLNFLYLEFPRCL